MQTKQVRLGRVPFHFAALALALLLGAQPASALDICRSRPVDGSGPVVSEARSVGRFLALQLNTDAKVVIRQGERHAVQVRAEGNVAPLIEAYVEDGTLVVEDSRHFRSAAAEVVITTPRVNSIATSGAVAVVAEGLTSPALSLQLGGSSAVSLRGVAIDRLHVALGGSSVLKVSGAAATFSSDLAGSSAVEASGLEAGAVSVAGGGSAQAVVWARDSLRAALGGSSSVGYYGNVTPRLATGGSASVKSLGSAPAKRL